MHKTILVWTLITILLSQSALVLPVYAQDATATPTPTTAATSSSDDAQKKSDLEKKIQEYETKLKDAQSEKNTLSAQINYMDNQIHVTGLRVTESEAKIKSTEKEIESLGKKIVGLDTSLDRLSVSMLERIKTDYKSKQASLLDIILDSANASSLLNRVKYYDLARESNQKILMQVQEAKLNFEKQKDLREKKVEELDRLNDTLKQQQQDLVVQKDSKRTLLQVTQNNENNYARLLEDSRRQLAAFKQFVQSTGLGVVGANSLGTGEGGWYLSQRDERWAGTRMGSSNESVLDVGCFITSIAMVMKKDGVDYTPSMIATNSQYFLPGTAYMYVPSSFNGSWPNGKRYRNISYSEISGYLGKGTPVIAGVRGSSHYIVLKKDDGSSFIMNDPIYGPDKLVSDYYSLSGPYGVFE